jgi:rod shape-determining protein MreB and related proteins
MFGRDIGIDLGTANVLIHVKGRGIVLNEPSVAAVDMKSGKIVAIGQEAFDMAGRTPDNITAVRPLKDGVIADFDKTEKMLKHFLDKINVKSMFGKPRVLICCPAQTGTVEKKAIREAVEKIGAKEIYLEEEPKVAAIGAGIDINQPVGSMIIDIGGGTTDIAVISMGTIVASETVKKAGDHLSSSIAYYIKRKHQLLVGERTAELIKMNIGSVSPEGRDETMNVRGRDTVNGLPRTVTITSAEISTALLETMRHIIVSATSVLERTPPELSADIIDRGIIITGGGACLHGVDVLLSRELNVPVFLAEDPLSCVVNGTGKMLEQLDQLVKEKQR